MTIAVIPVPGLPLINPGDDLARLLGDAIEAARVGVKARDVIAVCQKVVSKAEGAVVALDDVVASPFAQQLASRTESGKDPRALEVILRESARIVRMDRGHVICETRHGWVCANAGVDESNGVAPGILTLLPRGSRCVGGALCEALGARFGVELAIVDPTHPGAPGARAWSRWHSAALVLDPLPTCVGAGISPGGSSITLSSPWPTRWRRPPGS